MTDSDIVPLKPRLFPVPASLWRRYQRFFPQQQTYNQPQPPIEVQKPKEPPKPKSQPPKVTLIDIKKYLN